MNGPARSRNRLPLSGQLTYSSGNLGFMLLDNLMVTYMAYFYIPPDDSSLPQLIDNSKIAFGLTAIALVVLFGRVVDAIADPLVAQWSDHSKHKAGRRRIFMLWGGLPLGITCVALFFPPVSGVSAANAVYLALMSGAFLFFFTIYVAPYLALIPEFSHDQATRLNLTSYAALFMIAGTAIGMMAVPFLIGVLEKSGWAKAAAYRGAIIATAAVAVAFLYLACFRLDEKKYSVSTPSSLPFWESLLATLKDSQYMIYLVGSIAFQFAFYLVRQGALYYVTVLLGLKEGDLAPIIGVLFAVAIPGFFLCNFLSRILGKRNVFIVGCLIFSVLMALIYYLGRFPGGLSPMGQGFLLMGAMGIPVSAGIVLPNAIVADIAELNGLQTGHNREAMYFGTQGLFLKINLAISAAVLGFLLTYGKSVANPMGVRLIGPAAAVICLLGAGLLFLYDEKKVLSEIARLRAARGEAALR